jgi:hypothetical protein
MKGWVVLAYWLSGKKTVSQKVYPTKREAKQALIWLRKEFSNSLWTSDIAVVGSRYK